MTNKEKTIKQLKTTYPKIARLDELIHGRRTAVGKEEVANIVDELMSGLIEETSALLQYYDLVTNDTTMEGSSWKDETVFAPLQLSIIELKKALLEAGSTNASLAEQLEAEKVARKALENEIGSIQGIDAVYAEHARENAVQQARKWKAAYTRELYAKANVITQAQLWKLRHDLAVKEYEQQRMEVIRLTLSNERLREKNATLRVRLAETEAALLEAWEKNEEDDKTILELRASIAAIEEENSLARQQIENTQGVMEQRDSANRTAAGLRTKLKKNRVLLGVVAGVLGAGLVTSVAFNIAQGVSLAEKEDTIDKQGQKIDALETDLKNATDEYNKKIAELNTQHDQAIATLNAQHEQAIEELNAEWQTKINEIKDNYEAEIARIRAEHDAKVAELNARHAQEIADLTNAHQAEIDELNRVFEERTAEIQAELDKITAYAQETTDEFYTLAGLDWKDVEVEKKNDVSYVTTFAEDAEMTAVGEAHYALAMNSTEDINLTFADFTVDGNVVIWNGASEIIKDVMNNQNENQDDETKTNGGAGGVSDNNDPAGSQIGVGGGAQTDPVPETEEPEVAPAEGEDTNNPANAEVETYNAEGAAKILHDLQEFESKLNAGELYSAAHSQEEISAKIAEIKTLINNSMLIEDVAEANQLVEQASGLFAEVQSWITHTIDYGRGR